MLCFNVCDHFYCLGFQWQLLYVIWKWLLCFDLPQGVNFRILSVYINCSCFSQICLLCSCPLCESWRPPFLSICHAICPHTASEGWYTMSYANYSEAHQIQSKKDYWIRSSLFPWLNSLLLHGYAPFYRFYLWTYIQSVQREGTMESEPYLSKETVYNQTIFSHDAQHVWCFPDAHRHWAPMSLVQKHFQIIYGTQINLVIYEQSYWQII